MQGFVGLAALTILTLSSFRLFRQMAYETFLFVHIVTTLCVFIYAGLVIPLTDRLFLIGCYFHWDWQAYWVWVSLRLHQPTSAGTDVAVWLSVVGCRPIHILHQAGCRQQALAGEHE